VISTLGFIKPLFTEERPVTLRHLLDPPNTDH